MDFPWASQYTRQLMFLLRFEWQSASHEFRFESDAETVWNTHFGFLPLIIAITSLPIPRSRPIAANSKGNKMCSRDEMRFCSKSFQIFFVCSRINNWEMDNRRKRTLFNWKVTNVNPLKSFTQFLHKFSGLNSPFLDEIQFYGCYKHQIRYIYSLQSKWIEAFKFLCLISILSIQLIQYLAKAHLWNIY